MPTHPPIDPYPADPATAYTLAELRGDCARMAPQWTGSVRSGAAPRSAPPEIHPIAVPPASARMIASTDSYGDRSYGD